MKMRQVILAFLLVAFGAAAVFLNSYMKNDVVIMKSGAVISVNRTWDSGNAIFYQIGRETFVARKFEIDYYGKPNLRSLLRHAKYEMSRHFVKSNDEFKNFAKNTSHSLGQKSIWVISILAVTFGCIMLLLVIHLIVSNRQPNTIRSAPLAKMRKPAQAPETLPDEDAQEGITQSDIIKYFLNVFRLQVGADANAPMKIRSLSDNSGGINAVYELQIKHRGDWMRRRMSVGPLGEDAGSKSKCFYVIYDVHLVVKIPAKPIYEFDYYIRSIKKEGEIVDKLAPKECIIPRVSVLLNLIHKLPASSHLSPEKLEEKYVAWLRTKIKFQKYLKIKNTFVFFMDFSKYYFLGHIVDNLHDVKDAIAEEVSENSETIFDNQKFCGRYGKPKEAVGIEIRQVSDYCQEAIRQFLTDSGMASDVSPFRIQSWFLAHLAGKSVSSKESGLSDNLVHELNLLIELIFSKHMEAVTAYRNTITHYVHRIRFAQNKPQMAGIITNLLDLLAWLRTKQIAMRDLKPDNLLVAGNPSKYPLFLMNADEYELGIIDVETAVDFERKKNRKIKQPLLGGTPFYATPSHFFSNAVLHKSFHDLNKILHLQDWYATLVMIFKTVTGELMFQHTARLFADIRNKIKYGQMEGKVETEIVADVSRAFWRSALLEFQTKMTQKEGLLKSIVFLVPDTAKHMFRDVLRKDIEATAIKIKRCVTNQTFFESPQSQKRLLESSPAKIEQLQVEFEKKLKFMHNRPQDHSRAIVLLKYLRTLKLHAEQQKQLLTRLKRPTSRLTAYTLLAFMFNNLYKSMFREEWWVKPGTEDKTSDADVDEATLEASV
jgi:serine/threonine protein kinase